MIQHIYEGFFIYRGKVKSFGLFLSPQHLEEYAQNQRVQEPALRDDWTADVCMGSVHMRKIEVAGVQAVAERLVGENALLAAESELDASSSALGPEPSADESLQICPRPTTNQERVAGWVDVRNRINTAFASMDRFCPDGFGYALVECVGHPTHELHLRFIADDGGMANMSFHLGKHQVDDTVGRLKNLITLLECYRDES